MPTDLLISINEQNFSSIYSQVKNLIHEKSTQEAVDRENYYEGYHYKYNGQYRRDVVDPNAPGTVVSTTSGEYLYTATPDEVRMDIKSNFVREIVDTLAEHCIGVSDDDMSVIVDVDMDENRSELIKSFFNESDIEEVARCCFEDFTKHPRAVIRVRARNEDEVSEYKSPFYFECQDYDGFYPIYDVGGSMKAAVVAYYVDTTKLNEVYDYTLGSSIKRKALLYIEVWTDEFYFTMIEDKVQEINGNMVNPNPLGFIPFFFQNTSRSESSDVDNIISLQDAINKTISSMDFSESLSSFGLLSYDSSLDIDVIRAFQEANPNGITISPRSLIPISVNQIASQGIPSTSLEYLSRLITNISITSGIPVSILIGDESSESGRSRKIKYTKLISKCTGRRRKFNRLIEKMMRKITPFLINEKYYENMISITYPPVIEDDDRNIVELAVIKQSLGVSKQTILEELGYDPIEEIEKQKEYEEKEMETGINKVSMQNASLQAELDAEIERTRERVDPSDVERREREAEQRARKQAIEELANA